MSSIIPDDDYSPHDFLIILTCVFGLICVVGPLLIPRGPDQEFIRISIMLTSFFMWLAWVTVYSSQIYPTSGIKLKRSTLAWISYSWIHIGGENGKECTISKNGIIIVRMKCQAGWRKNSYLPFYIWYKNGNVVVKSGYDGVEHAKQLIHWNDPDPFDVNFYGLRSSKDDEIPMLVKNVEDDDWERLSILE